MTEAEVKEKVQQDIDIIVNPKKALQKVFSKEQLERYQVFAEAYIKALNEDLSKYDADSYVTQAMKDY